MSYIKEAFDKICEDNIKVGSFYVVLAESIPYYGGSEEGGWWGSDTIIISYKEFPTEELADSAKDKIMELADKLNKEAKKSFGKQCVREMEWLDSRGLDADYLPEPDGPSEYYVYVTDEIPQNSYGSRHYE